MGKTGEWAVQDLDGGKRLVAPAGTAKSTLLSIARLYAKGRRRGMNADYEYRKGVGVVDMIGRVILTEKEIEEEEGGDDDV